MSVDEARRLLLHDAARTAFGAEAALVLMEMLPPTGWGDVATRLQLEAADVAIRHELEARIDALDTKLGARIDRLDAKIDATAGALDAKIDSRADTLEWKLLSVIERGNRRNLQWSVGTMVAMTATIAALIRLG
jgi:hypothetical protein